MDREIIITKRFRNNTLNVYQYLLKKFSAKIAYQFILRIEKRIDFISKNPTVGKISSKRNNVRSIVFTPHSQIYYRYKNEKVELLCLFDMRKNPLKRPY